MPHRQETSVRIKVAEIVVRATLELVRLAHKELYAYKHLGAEIGVMLVAMSVRLGTMDGRPMSATKISHYLGIPRTSVIRALQHLTNVGYVTKTKSAYTMDLSVVDRRISARGFREAIRLLERASSELSEAYFRVERGLS